MGHRHLQRRLGGSADGERRRLPRPRRAHVVGRDPCATQDVPGVYTRLGARGLNAWVRDRVPMARASVSDPTVDPGEPVTFSVSAIHPGVARLLHGLLVGLRLDGTPAAAGASVTHTYADGGELRRASARRRGRRRHRDGQGRGPGRRSPPPPEPTPTATTVLVDRHRSLRSSRRARAQPAAVTQSVGRARNPRRPPRLAPRRAGPGHDPRGRRPKVGDGRFGIRVRFARSAPAGTRCRRGAPQTAAHRHRAGSRAARRDAANAREAHAVGSPRRCSAARSGRLTFKVRVRVGRRVLRSRTVWTVLDGARRSSRRLEHVNAARLH